MKKIASLIAVLVVICFGTMVMAAEPAKDETPKAAATDTISKPAAANPDNAAAPAKDVKAKKVKKAKKPRKKVLKKVDATTVDATGKTPDKAPATPAADAKKSE